MALYNTYNNENIITRAAIAGMLGVLNNNITYNQVWSNEEIEEINVPWFYNQSGDERFMQDFYTHYADCNFPKPVDGNFDQIPRGVITYSGTNIDSNRITNRFVQGRYLKEIEGKLQSFVSFLYSIPLTINFDCELWLDTQVTALKIEQAIREMFYKTVTFYVYYKGMRLGCTSGFSDSIAIEKLIEYSHEPDNRIKLTFNIEVETYQPVFDPTTEMDANNYMRGIGYKLYQHGQMNDGVITITTPSASTNIPKKTPLMIEWTYNKEGAIIDKVDAYWNAHGSTDLNLIEKGIQNNEFWFWNISDAFNTYKEPNIIWEETNNIKIHRQPNICIIPDLSTKIIDASSFTIVNEGYFIAPSTDSSINIILEMRDSSNNITYSGDNSIYFNISNYKINTLDPIWIDPSSSITFPDPIDYKNIDLRITNSVNQTVFGTAESLNIV